MLRIFNRERNELPQVAACLIGMAGPIAAGMLCGKTELGLLAAYGAMIHASSGEGEEAEPSRQHADRPMILRVGALLRRVFAGALGMLLGGLLGHHGWMYGTGMVLLSALAALVGGLGREAAVASAQFIIFMVMGAGMGGNSYGGQHHPGAVGALFGAGSLWGACASMLVSAVFPGREKRIEAAPGRVAPSFSKRLKWWRASLQEFVGWQYCLRMGLCMAVAEAVGALLHQERSYWIPLTVAIVLQRSFAAVATRVIRRGAGTVAGALLGGALLLGSLPPTAGLLLAAALAALRPIFRSRSYTVYSMLMTPLMVVLLGFGTPMSADVLFTRVLDTGIGGAIALVCGYFLWPSRLRQQVDKAQEERRRKAARAAGRERKRFPTRESKTDDRENSQ
ncbi:FUSC family protein [Brevibacillus sp. GCM10020057]|uniref:FUSC family protein n=1 Tax=Brevibacillus sp. GCM10020057 TaxID=3317327 RepID=UPI003636268F